MLWAGDDKVSFYWTFMFNVSTGKEAKGGQGKLASSVCSMAFDDGGSVLWAGDDKVSLYWTFMFNVSTGKEATGGQGKLAGSVCSMAFDDGGSVLGPVMIK